MEQAEQGLTPGQFARLANNYYTRNKIDFTPDRVASDSHLVNFLAANHAEAQEPKKVAFLWICTGPLYWQYAATMLQGAKRFFLPGHDVDYFLWSDMPVDDRAAVLDALGKAYAKVPEAPQADYDRELGNMADSICAIGPQVRMQRTEAVEWPLPTLMRYHLFLQREEELKEYDYIFYCDVDMVFTNYVGDEVLGEGLTAAPHPGYALRRNLIPPYEPNPQSEAYIPRPGRVAVVDGKPQFQPEYYAGGFQGGRAKDFIEAMKVMKKRIDRDYTKNYVAIWNDESHWNKYLFENPPAVMLDPSYVYPDSLVKEYYEPHVWGRSYSPRLVTLTKKFSTTKEGGDAVAKLLNKA